MARSGSHVVSVGNHLLSPKKSSKKGQICSGLGPRSVAHALPFHLGDADWLGLGLIRREGDSIDMRRGFF